MGQSYRLEVAMPASSPARYQPLTLTADSDAVLSIEVELKKDHRNISILTAKIHDPGWETFSALPDPAFADVPVKLYLGKPGVPRDTSHLVFDGKITEIAAGYPSVSTLTIVAHDKSIDARKRARYRTFSNKTSKQIAEEIAKDYGLTVDLENLGDVVLTQRNIEIGAEVSDWLLASRVLAADGLECYVTGSTLKIRQAAAIVYPVQMRRGEHPVVKLDVKIMHVRGPGASGDKEMIAPETAGKVRAVSGLTDAQFAAQAALEGATERTHRKPLSGVPTTATGAHSEDGGARAAYTNQVTNLRRRKDTATLTCLPMPDLTLSNTLNLVGWGAKVDGAWYPDTIHHVIAKDSGMSSTTISIHRAPSPGGLKAAGLSSASAQ